MGAVAIPLRRAPVVLISATVALAYCLWMARGGVADLPTLWVENLGQLCAASWAGVMCLRAARRPSETQRRTFLWLGVATLSWASGQAVWSWYELGLGMESPFPSFADLGFLLAVPAMVVGVAMFREDTGRLDGSGRTRVLLDGLTVGGSLLGLSWATALGAVYMAGGEGWLNTVLGLAYPVGDIVVVTIALVVLASGRTADRARLGLITAGVVALAVSDSTFALQTAVGAYEAGQLVGAGWVFGFLLIAAAALQPPPPATAASEVRERPSLWTALLPYVALALASSTVAARTLTEGRLDRVIVIDGLVVLLVVVARQIVALTQNTVLARQLSDAVGELEAREEELRRRALRDPLTGLANRALLDERLRAALARPPDEDHLGVLYCDLDGFKLINDVMGHAVGDRVLAEVAQRIQHCTRMPDVVARMGGDEFAVLLDRVAGEAEAVSVGERIVNALQEPITIDGQELFVHASIGAVVAAPGTTDGDALLRASDTAMYEAKRNRRGGVATFTERLGAVTDRRLEVAAGLHRALETGELRVHYQPMVEIATGEVVGVEALVRWQHPDRGLLAPGEFIAVAEETGMIIPIGRWVLEEACREVAVLRATGWPDLTVSVNLSAQQLRSVDAVGGLLDVISASGLPAAALCLEVTEHVLIGDDGECARVLHNLEQLGVTIAIDDFGTGYSSLSHLRRLPGARAEDRPLVRGAAGARGGGPRDHHGRAAPGPRAGAGGRRRGCGDPRAP